MRVETHTENRKALAKAIGEHLGLEARYDRVPRCTYSIGTVTVQKDGAITTDDAEAWAALLPFFQSNGWVVELPESADVGDDLGADESNSVVVTATPDATPDAPPDTAPVASSNNVTITAPLGDITPDALKHFTFMLYARQHLLNHSLGADFLNIPDSLIQKLLEHRPENAAAFGELLKAHGTVGIAIRDENIEMTLPFSADDPTLWAVYDGLLKRILRAAKCATRVNPGRIQTDSEKYSMRAWLLRLGYGSPDLKAERKKLLQNLTGHSAFPNDAAAQKHKDKYAAIRAAARGAEQEAAAQQPEVVAHDE